MAVPKEKERYTYADYCEWDDGKRWELIDGEAYAMSPAPSRAHQKISGRIHGQLFNYLKGKSCEVYAAPFDVRLTDDTVVQPDLLVVCDKSKLDDKGCVGAPDMMIEILSPSSSRHDRLIKFNRYQKAGVREYWIVDPDTRTVAAHVLENGRYTSAAYGDIGDAPVHVLEGCMIDLADVFAE